MKKLLLLVLILCQVVMAGKEFQNCSKAFIPANGIVKCETIQSTGPMAGGRDTWAGDTLGFRTCKVIYDMKEGLVSANRCSVIGVSLYRNDGMWLGNLEIDTLPMGYSYVDQPKLLSGTSELKAIKQYKEYMSSLKTSVVNDLVSDYFTTGTLGMKTDYKMGRFYHNDREVAFVSIHFSDDRYYGGDYAEYTCPKGYDNFEMNEDWTCSKNCQKGQKRNFDGFFWSECYTPFACGKDQYSVNDTTCAELPIGAKRNVKVGWTCSKGFYKSRSETDSSCIALPENSKITSDSTWECKKGFVEIDEQCVSKSTCTNEQLYAIETNECVNPPENSRWAQTEYPNKEFAEFICDSGYVLNNKSYSCEVIKSCTEEQYYDSTNNECIDPPENSYWAGSDFICNVGYYKVGYHCEKVPEHAYLLNDSWICDSGYTKIGNSCEEKVICTEKQRYDINKNRCFDPPKNGHWVNKTPDNFRYSCDSGFVDVGQETCEKKVECTDKHYIIGNTCYPLPTNSEKVSDYVWKCKGGFERIDDYCVKECDEDEILNDGKCKNIPSHAHKTKYNDYDCDFGYHYEWKSNGKAYCREDPRIKIREEENRSAWRHVTYETMMRDTDYNIEWPSTHFHFDIGGWVSVPDIGFEIGLEMLFGESELFGLFTDVAINHHVERQAHDEWETEYYTIDMVSMNVGFQLLLSRPTKNMRLYFKPMLSFPLTTKFDMDRYHREWVSNPVFPGIETGIRLWDLLDVGVRYSDHPVKIDGEGGHDLFKFVVRFSI